MSLYQLTIEKATRFYDLARAGALSLPEEDTALALFDVSQELTAAAGLPAYEISNHARPGHESRHNLIYWRYGEYAGAGPGAHSRIVVDGARLALANERHPETWRDLVARHGHGRTEETSLSRREQALEFLLMGLRLTSGISLSAYREVAGAELCAQRIERLSRAGLLTVDEQAGRLAATARGRRLLNSLITALAE
jgi:oxygen-independent coproporphyrinogen-3 oxidase